MNSYVDKQLLPFPDGSKQIEAMLIRLNRCYVLENNST